MPVKWGTQDRNDDQVPWTACLKNFSLPVFCGLVLLVFSIPSNIGSLLNAPDFLAAIAPSLSLEDRLLWACPMIASLVLSPAICRVTSKSLPDFLKRKLFVTKEEAKMPDIISRMNDYQLALNVSISTIQTEADAITYAYGDNGFINHRLHYTFKRHSRLPPMPCLSHLGDLTFFSSFYNREDYRRLCSIMSKVTNEFEKEVHKQV